MANDIQGNSHQAISWFLNRNSTSQKQMVWCIQSDEREKSITKNTLSSKTLLQIWWSQMLSRQLKLKEFSTTKPAIQQMVKAVNRKGKALPRENAPKTITKMVIGSNTSIITLNVNGLNAPNKRHWWKHVPYMYFHLPHHCLIPQTVCNYFIVRLIMFPLWLAIVIILYFLSGYWLWKLINNFYYCDCVTIIHLIPLYQYWSQENNRILHHQNCNPVITS